MPVLRWATHMRAMASVCPPAGLLASALAGGARRRSGVACRAYSMFRRVCLQLRGYVVVCLRGCRHRPRGGVHLRAMVNRLRSASPSSPQHCGRAPARAASGSARPDRPLEAPRPTSSAGRGSPGRVLRGPASGRVPRPHWERPLSLRQGHPADRCVAGCPVGALKLTFLWLERRPPD